MKACLRHEIKKNKYVNHRGEVIRHAMNYFTKGQVTLQFK